ncbi:MAG: M48 family metallopeptidase [Gammaproteobacteria bacterium]|nr:M48 family metallopeptidase [Gammaproteobacteria bacterium]
MNTLTVLFLFALTAMLITEFWLSRRQIQNIQQHRDSVPDIFSEQIDLSTHRKAADYTIARTRLGLVNGIYSALILLAFTLGGGLQLIDDLSRQLLEQPLLVGVFFIITTIFVGAVLEMPFALYKTFGLEARFGFNKTTPALYFTDLIKQTALFLIIGVPLLFVALWLMQASGKLWWLYLWLTWMAFNLLAMIIYPIWIAPLFNKFEPLQDESVSKSVAELMQRTGFKVKGLFVVDGSRRSAHSNAYFTGLGKSKRVVFFDTLLDTLSSDEIVAVLAHELGHFKRRHIIKRISIFFLISLLALALLGWLMQQDWFYQGLGITTASNHAALMLFMMAGPVFIFFIQPVSAWFSRKHEFEADDYARENADARDLISALLKLYRDNANTLTPDPVFSAFYDSHPPASIRIKHLQSSG